MKKRALILAMITFIAAATSEPSINMVRAEETQTEENTAQTSEPVSYTHLDVYKRQICSSEESSLSEFFS